VLTLEHRRSIDEKRLDILIQRLPEMKEVRSIDIKGRSLLNRNSDGDYRFSHFSFQRIPGRSSTAARYWLDSGTAYSFG